MINNIIADSFLAQYGYSTPWSLSLDRAAMIDVAAKLSPLASSPEMADMSINEAAALFYLMGYNQALYDAREAPESGR